jgi:hypothetical protein
VAVTAANYGTAAIVVVSLVAPAVRPLAVEARAGPPRQRDAPRPGAEVEAMTREKACDLVNARELFEASAVVIPPKHPEGER